MKRSLALTTRGYSVEILAWFVPPVYIRDYTLLIFFLLFRSLPVFFLRGQKAGVRTRGRGDCLTAKFQVYVVLLLIVWDLAGFLVMPVHMPFAKRCRLETPCSVAMRILAVGCHRRLFTLVPVDHQPTFDMTLPEIDAGFMRRKPWVLPALDLSTGSLRCGFRESGILRTRVLRPR